MTDYNPILATETDPDAPLRSSLFKRMVANPIAIAEGATGAPRVRPLAQVDFAKKVSHTGTTPDTVVFPYTCERLRVSVHIDGINIGSASQFRIRSSSDGGVNWGGYSNIVNVAQLSSSTTKYFGELEIDMLTGQWSFAYVRSSTGGSACEVFRATGTMSVAADADAIEFSFSAAGAGFNPEGSHTVYYVGTGA